MKSYYYYRVLRKTIIQFMDLFNDIKIARFDPPNDFSSTRKTITVPVVFAPKEKVAHWIKTRKDTEYIPIVSINVEILDYAEERKGNAFHNIVKSKSLDLGTISRFLAPTPFNITFTVRLWTLYMLDVDQILEQILPYFNPYVFIKINIPELDATMDVKVLFDTCAPETTLDLADDEYRVIKWSMTFRAMGYLFRKLTADEYVLIKKIMANMYTDEDRFEDMIGTESTYTSGASASESLYMRVDPTSAGDYYDEDEQILYAYEIFPGGN